MEPTDLPWPGWPALVGAPRVRTYRTMRLDLLRAARRLLRECRESVRRARVMLARPHNRRGEAWAELRVAAYTWDLMVTIRREASRCLREMR